MKLKTTLFWLTPLMLFANNPVSIDAIHLGNSVYYLRTNSPLGNPSVVALILPEETFLADASFETASVALKAKIKELGGGPIRWVTGTHHHGDHTEGFESLDTRALIMTPHTQRERLRTGSIYHGKRPLSEEALPRMTFQKEVFLYFPNEVVELFTPQRTDGHTDGDVFVYFRTAKVLYMGDHFFLNRYPIVDLNSGGSIDGYFQNIENILKTYDSDTKFIPGHGSFAPDPVVVPSHSDLSRYLKELKASVVFIRKQLRAGVAAEQIMEQGLPERFSPFSQKPRYVSPDNWIQTIMKDFTLHQAN